MKKILCLATVVACFASFSLTAQAQSAGNVAVIDISRIFKEHQRFRAALTDMKKDVEAAEAGLRKDAEAIKKMAQDLQSGPYAAGSPQYKQQEELIATKQAQIQLKMNLQKKEFMEREAKVYYQVYMEIEEEVRKFAQRHRINLVLRYNNIEMKPEDRPGVLAGVNRAVVYQNNIDITKDILDAIQPPGEARLPNNRGFLPPQ